MEKVCLSCGERLLGRSDKKFCSDSCRNNYHHHALNENTNFIRNISNQLKRNRMILKDLNPDGKSRTKRETLLKAGFNFKYFTHIYTTKDGRTYYFVFDQGYTQHENDYFTLVQNEEI
ncbi:MAG: hypothetical protein HOO86_17925 [Bacteroidales bacterium]|nr:hypothetical protein [Bacteroidales bacterium]